MKIIDPSVEILNPPNYQDMLRHIEIAGRTCYKSDDKITDDSAESFIKRLISSGHESVLEHDSISVRFICDRGVSHELVRHRICSFSQESTRYCNYSGDKFGNEITVIRPLFWDEFSKAYGWWIDAMAVAEHHYLELIKDGATPQEARSVLTNSLKTEIVVTASIRQWRTMFEQRVSIAAHPQMIQVMAPLLEKFICDYTVFFEDINGLSARQIKEFNHKGWQLAEVK